MFIDEKRNTSLELFSVKIPTDFPEQLSQFFQYICHQQRLSVGRMCFFPVLFLVVQQKLTAAIYKKSYIPLIEYSADISENWRSTVAYLRHSFYGSFVEFKTISGSSKLNHRNWLYGQNKSWKWQLRVNIIIRTSVGKWLPVSGCIPICAAVWCWGNVHFYRHHHK